jgi:hypothetical protein
VSPNQVGRRVPIGLRGRLRRSQGLGGSS